ncbi:MAG TPA: FmdB family zinc ribbon protein [Aeromicrobium sp.]|nr:FmdB family zinc ribbon protein [Aeromicrobium sp.]
MPTYQYSCTECGEALEVQQSFADDPLTVCPACQGRLRKVYNAVGVVFKGSGFYRTDSRASAGSKGSSSTSDSPSTSESPAASKSASPSSSKEGSGSSAPAASGATSPAS